MGRDVVLLFVGWFLGLFTPLVYIPVRRTWTKWRAVRDERETFGSLDGLGFFTLNSWSPRRILERAGVTVTHSTSDWDQDWLPESLLQDAHASIDDPGGPSSSLRSMEVDHRESARGQRLVLSYARSEYRDFLAVSRVLGSDPARVEGVLGRLRSEEAARMIEKAPRSVTAINVTVLSDDLRLLMIRRSAAVRTSQNEWTLGPNETMLGPLEQAGGVEGPFQLAERCLWEELGVELDEVSFVAVSWVGYNVPGAICHWLAHSRLRLRSEVISQRMKESHGGFEVDAIDWMKFDPRALEEIRLRAEDGVPDGDSRVWNRTAGLAAQDIRRWKSRLLSG